MMRYFISITDWMALITYPALFVLFLMLAVLAVIDNVNRLRNWERVAFHLLLALIFAMLGMINPISPIISLDMGRRLVRILSAPLIIVMLPSVARSISAALITWRRERREQRISDGQITGRPA